MHYEIKEAGIRDPDTGGDNPGFKVSIYKGHDLVHESEVVEIRIAFEIIKRFQDLSEVHARQIESMSATIEDVSLLGAYDRDRDLQEFLKLNDLDFLQKNDWPE